MPLGFLDDIFLHRGCRIGIFRISNCLTSLGYRFTNGPKLYYGYGRSTTAKLAQLRTGHCRLNSYLYRFNIVESAECKCHEGKETVEHFLLVCKRYTEERKILRKRVGLEGMKVRHLLGDKKAIKHTMKFINNTKRLD